jgi:hypothetical protein
MANEITRLLPYRNPDEKAIINMYALDDVTGAAGSVVKIKAANLSEGPVDYTTRGDANSWTSSFGHATSKYPTATSTVTKVEGTGEAGVLGILLRDVRNLDENGENLLYYPQKRDELQCVMSGQVNPIATKGEFLYNVKGLAGGVAPVLGSIAVPSVDGTLTGVLFSAASQEQKDSAIGKWLATGTRTSEQDTDAFAGAYALLKLEL